MDLLSQVSHCGTPCYGKKATLKIVLLSIGLISDLEALHRIVVGFTLFSLKGLKRYFCFVLVWFEEVFLFCFGESLSRF
jgi:hypothetical protein